MWISHDDGLHRSSLSDVDLCIVLKTCRIFFFFPVISPLYLSYIIEYESNILNNSSSFVWSAVCLKWQDTSNIGRSW